MAECQSVYCVGLCCHGCIHQEGHEEKHLCACGVDWTDDDQEEECGSELGRDQLSN